MQPVQLSECVVLSEDLFRERTKVVGLNDSDVVLSSCDEADRRQSSSPSSRDRDTINDRTFRKVVCNSFFHSLLTLSILQ